MLAKFGCADYKARIDKEKEVPDYIHKTIEIRPIPLSMYSIRNKGRRQARVKTLDKRLIGNSSVLYAGAAIYTNKNRKRHLKLLKCMNAKALEYSRKATYTPTAILYFTFIDREESSLR